MNFLHPAISDEFDAWTVRRPNQHNHRAQAKCIEDTQEDERYGRKVQHRVCNEIFIMFTCKRSLWVIEDTGELWTCQYFLDVILTGNVFSFRRRKNVVGSIEAVFVHDEVPDIRADTSQHLIQDNGFNFSNKSICS